MRLSRQLIKIFWLPAGFFLLNEILSRAVALYERYPWIDIPMHAIGGMIVAWSMSLVVNAWQQKKYLGKVRPIIRVVFITALVGTIAVLWEFHEFARDRFLGEQTQPNLADTMGDLFLGLVGGWSVAMLTSFWSRLFPKVTRQVSS